MRLALLLLAAASLPVAAADSKPEITRGQVTPQAVGAAHTVRTIPEACARLEGMFTGDAAQPYKFAVVRTSPNCQPRARFVDADKAAPSEKSGWKFNDLIRIPNAACPTQLATVRVWRKPAQVTPPKLDAQGQSRIYLDEQRRNAAANKLPAVAMFAARMNIEGLPCGG
ncbi:MAG TPA: hypothetical protein VK827_00505 [Lysobacter sp.]|nr:hypothetical protein [Lysobacter sp.]